MRFCFSLAAILLVVAAIALLNESESARARVEVQRPRRAEALAARHGVLAKEQL